MNKKPEVYDCIAVIGSVTRAMRAQSVLRAAGVGCVVVKAESGKLEQGCVYGVSCSCRLRGQIEGILKSVGIGIRSFERGGGL